MARWLCIDPGTRRIGVAAGSLPEGICSPVEAVPANPPAKAIERICELAGQYRAEGIVVGWAINMDGSEGPAALLARKLAADLASASRLDVRLWDERLSSFAADKALAGMMTRKKKRLRQDALAASYILKDFFDCDGPNRAQRP